MPLPVVAVSSTNKRQEIMRTASEYPLITLCVISPPYRQMLPVSHRAIKGVLSERLGSLICIDVQDSSLHWLVLRDCVHELRSLYPIAPLILCLPDPTDSAAVALTSRAISLRIRAVLVEPHSIYDALRESMTDPTNLDDDVSEWALRRIGGSSTPETAHLLRYLIAQAVKSKGATSEIQSSFSIRRARRCLARDGLPPPSSWRRVGKALETALAVQAEPNISLLEIAYRLGYSDQSSLSHQFRRLFELSPSAVRGTLGWEWLLERWFRRATAERGHRSGTA
jgi:AraC-like DNA-binding protein